MRVGRRCFVSNLAWRTSWQDLKDKFRDCGTVVYANVIRDEAGEWVGPRKAAGSVFFIATCRVMISLPILTSNLSFGNAGRSKGWGIVEFESPEEVSGFPICT